MNIQTLNFNFVLTVTSAFFFQLYDSHIQSRLAILVVVAQQEDGPDNLQLHLPSSTRSSKMASYEHRSPEEEGNLVHPEFGQCVGLHVVCTTNKFVFHLPTMMRTFKKYNNKKKALPQTNLTTTNWMVQHTTFNQSKPSVPSSQTYKSRLNATTTMMLHRTTSVPLAPTNDSHNVNQKLQDQAKRIINPSILRLSNFCHRQSSNKLSREHQKVQLNREKEEGQ